MSKKLLRELVTTHGIQILEEYGGTIVVPDCQFDRSWTKKLESLGCRVITKSEGVRYIVLPKDPDTKPTNPQKKPTRGWKVKWTNEQDAVITNAVDPKKKLWGQGKKILEEYNKVKKPEWPTRTVSGIRNRIYMLIDPVKAVAAELDPEPVNAAATGKSEIQTIPTMLYGVTLRIPFFAVTPETQQLDKEEMRELRKELKFIVYCLDKGLKLEEP